MLSFCCRNYVGLVWNVSCRIIKNIFKNGIVCRDIKTEKAQEHDWDCTLATKLN